VAILFHRFNRPVCSYPKETLGANALFNILKNLIGVRTVSETANSATHFVAIDSAFPQHRFAYQYRDSTKGARDR
jgi:hypothetical protein